MAPLIKLGQGDTEIRIHKQDIDRISIDTIAWFAAGLVLITAVGFVVVSILAHLTQGVAL